MAIGIGFSSADGSDSAILPPREHPCLLTSIAVTEGDNFDKTEKIQQLKWTFEGMQWKSPEGKSGVISQWTGFNYGNSKSKLTALLDQVFGRSLTESEAKHLDMEKLVGSVKGYVMVLPHKKADGTMTSKFGGFRFPDGKTPLDPKDFFTDNYSAAPSAAAQAPTPKDVSSSVSGSGDPFEDGAADPDGLEDPFAE